MEPHRWNEIFIDLTNRANDFDREAMNIIHDHYINERDTLQTFDDKLVQFYVDGANENKPYSLYYLAIMYYDGKGVEENMDRFEELIQKSMESGCSQAFVFMADDTQSYDEYTMYLKKALSMDNSSAYVEQAINLSRIKYNKDSVKLYKKAINLGNTYAIFKLGELYHDNQKFNQAIKYYSLAMEKNVMHAYFNMAVMYREGEGVTTNMKKALKLFVIADSMKSRRAMSCIGKIYQDLGKTKKAKECYLLSIEKYNDPISAYNIGLIYQTENHHKLAIKYFIIGAKSEHPASRHTLLHDYAVTKYNMTDTDIDELLRWHQKMQHLGAYDGYLSK